MAMLHAKSKYYSRRLILPLIIALCTFVFVIISSYIHTNYGYYLSELDDELYDSVIKYLSLFFCSLSLFLIVDANNAKARYEVSHDTSFGIITRYLSIFALFVTGFCLLDFYLDNIVCLTGTEVSLRCIYTSSFITSSCIKHLLPKVVMYITTSVLFICVYSCVVLILKKHNIEFNIPIKLDEKHIEIKQEISFISKLSLGFRYSSVP